MTASPTAQGTPAGRVRWSMIWLAFGAVTINYLDRANLGVALPYMTEDLDLSKTATGCCWAPSSGRTRRSCPVPAGWSTASARAG